MPPTQGCARSPIHTASLVDPAARQRVCGQLAHVLSRSPGRVGAGVDAGQRRQEHRIASLADAWHHSCTSDWPPHHCSMHRETSFRRTAPRSSDACRAHRGTLLLTKKTPLQHAPARVPTGFPCGRRDRCECHTHVPFCRGFCRVSLLETAQNPPRSHSPSHMLRSRLLKQAASRLHLGLSRPLVHPSSQQQQSGTRPSSTAHPKLQVPRTAFQKAAMIVFV
jgi:hypothetical protein